MEDDDMKYVWAAYKRGVFDHIPAFEADMDPYEFRGLFLALLGENVLGRGGEIWTFIANTRLGEIPVGLVMATPSSGRHLEPHVFWFPEASTRNRLECALKWLNDMKRDWKLDLWIPERHWKFFDHLCKYGVIRTVGKRRKFFENDDDAYLFQEVS